MTVPRIQPASVRSMLWIRLDRRASRAAAATGGNGGVFDSAAATERMSHRVPILPWRAVAYFLISLVIVAGGLLVVDRLVSVAEHMGDLSSEVWREGNRRINQNNFNKVLANGANPIWRSRGFDQLGLVTAAQASLNPQRIDPATSGTSAGPGLGMHQAAAAEAHSRSHRILVMGDSFVWGDGYSNMNNTWWRALQRELIRRGYGDVEVFGAGLCGWSTRDQVNAAPKVVEQISPDVIIWGFVTNDPDEKRITLDLNHNAPKTPENDPQTAARSVDTGPAVHDDVLVGLRDQLNQARVAKTEQESDDPFTAYSYNEWEHKLYSTPSSLELYRKTLEQVAEVQKRSGVPGFFMTLPMLSMQNTYKTYYGIIGPMVIQTGMIWYDILPEFIRAYPQDKQEFGGILHWGINPANGHPGTAATHFYARCAADYLEAHYPEALGPKSTGSEVGPAALSTSQIVINDWQPWYLQIEPVAAQSTEPGAATWRIHMPTDDDQYMVAPPLDTPSVLVSFDMPVHLKRIEIRESAPGTLSRTSVWASWWNPTTGFDDNMQTFPLNPRDGKRVEWLVRGDQFAENVDALRIHARFRLGTAPEKRVIDLTLVPASASN